MEKKLSPEVLSALEENQIEFRVFECDPEFADTYAFCEKYGFPLGQAANTILIASRSGPLKFACCVALATTKLDVNKKVCELLGVKRASFALPEQTKELTGMEIGGVTVFGIKDTPIFIDSAVLRNNEVVMGGGNRSSKVLLNPNELRKLQGAEIIENLAIPKEQN